MKYLLFHIQAYDKMKLKQVFTILLIFLFCFYGIWLSQAKAQNASITKDSEQVPVNNEENKEKIQAFDAEIRNPQNDITKEDPIASEIKDEKDVQQKLSVDEDHQSNVTEVDAYSATSQITHSSPSPDKEVPLIKKKREDQASVVDNKQQENSFDEEKSSSPEEERASISHLTNTEENESRDREEEDISSHLSESFPVTVLENKTLSEFGIDDGEIPGKEYPDSVDKRGIVTDKDTLSDVEEKENPSASSRAETSAHSFEERESLAQEEEGRQTSKSFGEQRVIVSDEESISLLSEEKASIDPESIGDEKTNQQEPVREITTSEIQVLPVEQSGVSLTTSDDRPYSDIVENKTPASDTVDEKNLQENPPVNEDDEKFVAEKETSPAADQITASNLTPNEEVLSIEEEKGDQASVADNKQHEKSFDEEKSSSSEEERSSISHLTNTGESESQDREKEDFGSHIPEHFPATVHDKEAFSDFGTSGSKISEEASVADNKQQEKSFDEEKPSSSEEERSSISHLTNTEESESQDREKEDFGSHIPEHFPATVHDKEAFSDFGTKDSKISEVTSPGSEDKQGIVSDEDLLSDVKEKETRPITSTVISSTHSPPEKETLVQEKEEIQTSKDFEEQPEIRPDGENISLLSAEKSPIDSESISNEEITPQNREDEDISSSLSELPEMDVIEDNPSETEGDGAEFTWQIWHTDPTQSIILAVVIALIVAKLGGWIARTMGFPGVVGKLILGMILGNIYLLTGSDYFEFLKTMPFLKMLSYFGTLILLLTAGLHTDLRAIFRVGTSSVLVCLGGMVVPAGLGLVVSHFLLPDSSTGSKVLLSIILCSTSTGLLFAILNELKIMDTIEGRVIVGATILTEIIVILSFGIVSGIVVKGGVSLIGISVSFGVAIFLLITAVIIIVKYGERFGNFLTNRLTDGLNIPIIVILSLLMAFMFGSIGLHTVIGAFIAGLFLRNVKLRNSDEDEHRNVESFIRPFYALLVPILFLRVGAQVDLQSFLNLNAVLLGLNITGAAILGKLFCSICLLRKGQIVFLLVLEWR
ncbi:MAG: sodium/potassium proton antiport protein GerN [Candidatus Scalindua brodae]|uniref:Sodium/potassium proton antiport protein GerN n=1 Tax=Candidatus Scalindua brodae TaxID=237368 RepID=A0A0B0EPQ0_9BACT|nr:MAG: sodium/potassium proton antiport protein GerN [Candidatus Scalindua brodae]